MTPDPTRENAASGDPASGDPASGDPASGDPASGGKVLGDLAPEQVRVRFCPSPTGNPHVGLVRTALFNWAFARHYGGTVVFRIEDTDAARDSAESYTSLLDAMRWLGLEWDEGPEAGGDYGPYHQSERADIYRDIVGKLVKSGLAYESCSTTEEVAQRRTAAGQDPKLGYDNADRDLSYEARAAFRAEGREPVIRLRMPERTWRWDDLVRGPITVEAEHVPDYVIVRANGQPLYPLVNPVDDALMGITHVLRGEDLLSSTPRQLAMHEALATLGMAVGPTPRYGHLPLVTGEGSRKLSKRDPESSLQYYRDRGFLPEGLLNYLALLGWSLGDDVEVFSQQQMYDEFDITRVTTNPARFDLRKAEALNGVWLRSLPTDEVARRVEPYLHAAGLIGSPPSESERVTVAAAAPLIQERMATLDESVTMLGFLLVADDELTYDETAVAKVLASDSTGSTTVVTTARTALAELGSWTTEAIEDALRAALVDGLGQKPRKAFGPVRVAITGRQVSPPLFE